MNYIKYTWILLLTFNFHQTPFLKGNNINQENREDTTQYAFAADFYTEDEIIETFDKLSIINHEVKIYRNLDSLINLLNLFQDYVNIGIPVTQFDLFQDGNRYGWYSIISNSLEYLKNSGIVEEEVYNQLNLRLEVISLKNTIFSTSTNKKILLDNTLFFADQIDLDKKMKTTLYPVLMEMERNLYVNSDGYNADYISEKNLIDSLYTTGIDSWEFFTPYTAHNTLWINPMGLKKSSLPNSISKYLIYWNLKTYLELKSEDLLVDTQDQLLINTYKRIDTKLEKVQNRINPIFYEDILKYRSVIRVAFLFAAENINNSYTINIKNTKGIIEDSSTIGILRSIPETYGEPLLGYLNTLIKMRIDNLSSSGFFSLYEYSPELAASISSNFLQSLVEELSIINQYYIPPLEYYLNYFDVFLEDIQILDEISMDSYWFSTFITGVFHFNNILTHKSKDELFEFIDLADNFKKIPKNEGLLLLYPNYNSSSLTLCYTDNETYNRASINLPFEFRYNALDSFTQILMETAQIGNFEQYDKVKDSILSFINHVGVYKLLSKKKRIWVHALGELSNWNWFYLFDNLNIRALNKQSLRFHKKAFPNRFRQKRKLKKSNKIALIGGLNYGVNETNKFMFEDFRSPLGKNFIWSYLDGTVPEIDGIKDLIKHGQVVNRIKAQELIEYLEHYEILHIATHGGYRSGYSPTKSSFIVLTGANLDSAGSYCYVEDILSSDSIITELVFLSACRSGQGYTTGISPPISIVNTLLNNGTSYVISSNWNLRDDYAKVYVHSFYQQLKKYSGNVPKAFFKNVQKLKDKKLPKEVLYAFQLNCR